MTPCCTLSLFQLQNVGMTRISMVLHVGSWSFGDYFKERAIAMSWECLTEVRLPSSRKVRRFLCMLRTQHTCTTVRVTYLARKHSMLNEDFIGT